MVHRLFQHFLRRETVESAIRTNPVVQPKQYNVTEDPASFKLDGSSSVGAADVAQFQAALKRQQPAFEAGAPKVEGTGKASLGDKIMTRANSLAGEMKNDQAYVSKLLEQATRTGDSMQLMKAMMALSDYQTRVQFVSKTISKATSSLDQLTRMQ